MEDDENKKKAPPPPKVYTINDVKDFEEFLELIDMKTYLIDSVTFFDV